MNRFFVPYLNEAARLAEENVASLATIEEVGREMFGATLGPFELMNVTGIPIAFHSETLLAAVFGGAGVPGASKNSSGPARGRGGNRPSNREAGGRAGLVSS